MSRPSTHTHTRLNLITRFSLGAACGPSPSWCSSSRVRWAMCTTTTSDCRSRRCSTIQWNITQLWPPTEPVRPSTTNKAESVPTTRCAFASPTLVTKCDRSLIQNRHVEQCNCDDPLLPLHDHQRKLIHRERAHLHVWLGVVVSISTRVRSTCDPTWIQSRLMARATFGVAGQRCVPAGRVTDKVFTPPE